MPPRGYLQALIKLLKGDCLAIALCPARHTDANVDTDKRAYTLDMNDIELLERAEVLLWLTDLDGTGRTFMDVVALMLLMSMKPESGNSNRSTDSNRTAIISDQASAVSVDRHPLPLQTHQHTFWHVIAYRSFRPKRHN